MNIMVTFYEIGTDGKPGKPVLFLDTLKVSSIEQTAETAEARGGKGNPALISWDFGKEITVNIEDALFSPKSMNIMFGNSGANIAKTASSVERIAQFTFTSGGGLPEVITTQVWDENNGYKTAKVDCNGDGTIASGADMSWPTSYMSMNGVFLEDGTEIKTSGADPQSITTPATWASASVSSANANKRGYLKYYASANKATITITKDSFPGTYYVIGDKLRNCLLAA